MTSRSRQERRVQLAAARPGSVRWLDGDPLRVDRDAHNREVDQRRRDRAARRAGRMRGQP